MKLLFDQNLSPRLPRILANIYPESIHVREIGIAPQPTRQFGNTRRPKIL
jgi:predicted nuclease of predicted toxin-antitoxin system